MKTPSVSKAKMPKAIKVGPYDIAVVEMNCTEAEANFGTWSPEDLQIKMRRQYASPAMAVDTLLHEVGHAIWSFSNLHHEDGEERIVNGFSTALTQVFRDNPDFLTWIKASLK